MSTPLRAELLQALLEQLPAEFDELLYFAAEEPLVFYATLLGAHEDGRLQLPAELRSDVRTGLIGASRATRPAPKELHATPEDPVVIIPSTPPRLASGPARPDEGELTGAL